MNNNTKIMIMQKEGRSHAHTYTHALGCVTILKKKKNEEFSKPFSRCVFLDGMLRRKEG